MQNKRITVIFIVLIFCACLALGGSVIFSVSDVRLTCTVYSETAQTEVNSIDESLSVYKGKNIYSVKKADVEKIITAYPYYRVDKITKKYPNILEVSITERLESLAVYDGQVYTTVSEDGYVLGIKSTNLNNIDGLKNIIYEENTDLTIGIRSSDEKLLTALNALGICNDVLRTTNENDNVRNMITTIKYSNGENLNLVCKEGVTIVIAESKENLSDKLRVAINFYTNLETAKKINRSGKIIAVTGMDGNATATYSTNSIM